MGYRGFKIGGSLVAKIVPGIGAPLLAAIVWGTFLAPRASVPMSAFPRLVLELVVFGLAAALYSAGRPTLAWVLTLAFVINRVLLYAWGQ